jgi:hypothetical protein
VHDKPDVVLRAFRVAIPEPENPIALSIQPVRTLFIMLDLIGFAVLSAVHFHNEPSGMRDKIEDVTAEFGLTSPIQSSKRSITQQSPYHALLRGHFRAQSF